MSDTFAAFWFRRDLRLDDNAGLFHALTSGKPVIPVFIFDREILDQLPAEDARVDFIHRSLHELQAQLAGMGSSLSVCYGLPSEIWPQLLKEFPIQAVYTNHDYEPYARQRDGQLADFFRAQGVDFHTFKDQVIFEKDEVLTGQGTPYTVFTPYSRKWKATLTKDHLKDYGTEAHFTQFFKSA